MFEHFYTYGNTTGILNTLETDKDIKVFLSKYKQWYIKERNFSKNEAEWQIRSDISYILKKFLIKDDLSQKLKNMLRIGSA